jgi:hypothetical protein
MLLLGLLGYSWQLDAQQVEDVVTGLDNPFGIELDGGELYISSQNVAGSNPNAGQITKIDPAAANPSPSIVAQLDFSASLEVYNGFLYVTDINSIRRIDLSATMPSPEVVVANLNFPNGLLVIGEELYFCQTATSTVDKINLNQMTPTVTPVVTQGLSGPVSLEHRDGILYIAESDNAEVSTVDLNSGNLTPTPLVTGLDGVLDIVLDGDFMYVVLLNSVARFNPSEASPTAETVIGNLDAPHGAAFVDGVLHLTEYALGKVIRVTQVTPAWSAPAPVCPNVESITLGGASPTGGVYSGAGVTDNGDGETFTFNATAVMPGNNTLTYTVDGQSVSVEIEVSAGLMVDASMASNYNGANVSCNGAADGQAVVSATGGAFPYTFAWSDGQTTTFASGLAAGTYSVTVTDANGCEGTAAVTLTEPDPISVTFTTMNDTGAMDGSITASATGGTSPYTYMWSNGLTGNSLSGLAGGDYTVTVTDANGCTGMAEGVVEVVNSCMAEAGSITGSNQTLCQGETITVTVMGNQTDPAYTQVFLLVDDFTGEVYDIQSGPDLVFNTVADINVVSYNYLTDGGSDTNPSNALSIDCMNNCCDVQTSPWFVTVQASVTGSFTAPADLCVDAGIQAGLGGGAPAGGAYSGPGVTDDGNGSTYSFDPAVAGVGVQTITYTPAGSCVSAASDQLEVFAAPIVTFSAPGPFNTDAGVQPLTGGMPAGGTYSGMGVIDNGDGTFSFDPSIGAGNYTVAYTFTDGNGCTGLDAAEIVVEEAMLVTGDMCTDAIDINPQFGQAPGEVQSSGPYDNTDATTDASDPDFGWECFGEPDGGGGAPSLERTLWYTFTGDGNNYFIEALACGDDPIDFGDTQYVIYSGDCDNLEAVLCSEDGPNAQNGGPFPAGDTLQTEAGVNYYIMVDGFGPDFPADGEFCLEVTNLTEPVVPVTVTFQVDATLLVDNGELAADGMFLAGSFSDFNNIAMEDMDGDNVWTAEVEMDAGTSQEYKFKNGADGWENIDTSLGDDCTTGEFGNRALGVGDMDMTLDPVCFAYCVSCVVVDVDETALESGISVFPNPVRDILNVQVDLPAAAESLNIRLLNTLGQEVLSSNYGQLQSDNIELDMSQLPAGTYLLQVRDGRAQFTRSVVVQR